MIACLKCKEKGFKTINKRERVYACRNCGHIQSVIYLNGVPQAVENKSKKGRENA